MDKLFDLHNIACVSISDNRTKKVIRDIKTI